MSNKFDAARQNKLAEDFRALHHRDEMLVLVNAWDSASARMVQEAGLPAIATTSSGISWACGFKDGEHIPPDLMIEVVRQIASSVTIPVSADIEAGYYGNDLEQFSKFIEKLIEAGAVGINLEDSDSKTHTLVDVAKHVAKVKQAKKTGHDKGVNLFVNARTDAIELAPGDINQKIQACIERAKAYEEAGADGIFIPFVEGMDTIARLKAGVRLPLNILMNDTLDVAGLRRLKINRVSVGGKPMLATLNLVGKIAQELKSEDDWHSLYVKEPIYPTVNNWF